MNDLQPAGPWWAEIDRAVEVVMKGAESLGFKCIPQYFAMTVVPSDEGEFAFPMGPMRYVLRNAKADALASDYPAGVSFIVRVFDPDDEAGYAQMQAEAKAERDSA